MRKINRLNSAAIASLVKDKAAGRHPDGDGLYLQITKDGSASWILLYRHGSGQRSMMGLGSLRLVSLQEARRKRDRAHKLVSEGRDPLADRKAALFADLEASIAVKAAEFIRAGTEPACYLYRHFDPRGDLIYIGVSLSPLRRNEMHVGAADWRQTILKILIEPFATREEALEAEKRAIRDEFPRFNQIHNRRRSPARELAKIEESDNAPSR